MHALMKRNKIQNGGKENGNQIPFEKSLHSSSLRSKKYINRRRLVVCLSDENKKMELNSAEGSAAEQLKSHHIHIHITTSDH